MRSLALPQINQRLLLLILSVVVLYYGRPFLVPVAFAALLAMLLLPIGRRLESWGIGRAWAAVLCILLLVLMLGGIGLFLGAQAASISKQLPQLERELQQLLGQGQQWIERQFGVAPQEQIQFVQKQIGKFSQSANRYLTASLRGLMGLLSGLALVLLYLFFFLWGRGKFREFLLRLAPAEQRAEAGKMMNEMTQVAAQYLSGRLLSMLFLAACYALGFSLIGLKNALLMSVLAALPTLIPYVGIFIGSVFPLLMALAGGAGQVLPTAAILLGAEVIDNNFLEPLVMGARLNLSPIFTIAGVVAGELIWGIPGMLLFEPLLAIIRIGCSHVPALHPYAFLLEDETSESGWVSKLKGWFRRLRGGGTTG